MNNNNHIYISICIPAFERTKFLKRLLDSISIQSFTFYEIIISDDSVSDNNKILVENYKHLDIKYIKNTLSLGSPKNWNHAVSFAKYEWIKIMHDDDYFDNKNSLDIFAKSIQRNIHCNFFFSSHYKLHETKQLKTKINVSWFYMIFLKYSRMILFHKNLIGHPSCTLYKKDEDIQFDNKFKWVVDIEFYYRYLNKNKIFTFISEPVIVVSDNESQITKQVFRKKDIEIPENLQMLNNIGESKLNNLILFDYFWRLFRNLGIKNYSEISGYQIPIPWKLEKMIEFQSKFSSTILKIGIVSKLTMFIYYFYTCIHNNNAKN